MNETELQAYAVRGLTSRLEELDRERERIHELLAVWTVTARTDEIPQRRSMSEDARRRIGDATRKRWSERRAVTPGAETHVTAEPGAEAARVLPRRGTSLRRKDATPPAPALPPMPRLIKKAS